MLAYFMSRIRIDALHINDVLPPNGAQILVYLNKFNKVILV